MFRKRSETLFLQERQNSSTCLCNKRSKNTIQLCNDITKLGICILNKDILCFKCLKVMLVCQWFCFKAHGYTRKVLLMPYCWSWNCMIYLLFRVCGPVPLCPFGFLWFFSHISMMRISCLTFAQTLVENLR